MQVSPIVPLPTDHCRGISEDDPNYLLKMLTLKPEKGYVPTFLREDLAEDDSGSGWLGTYESEKESVTIYDEQAEPPIVAQMNEYSELSSN